MVDPSRLTPALLVEELARHGLSRASFVYSESAGLISSHPGLAPLAESLLSNARDYDRHEAVFLEVGERTGALLGAFLHRTTRGQGIGGVRLWPYDSVQAFMNDGLRLSRGMGRKNALAGLWWGGGKGVIARPPGNQHRDPAFRAELFQDYGSFITSLRGAYVTAEDVGTTPDDMVDIYRTTRFVVCVPPAVGGSGNPSPATARGVVCAMEGALEFAGLGSLADKVVALQGVGNVGGAMVPLLLERGVQRIIAAETSHELCRALQARYAQGRVQVRLVTPDDVSILSEPCDILAPNALGGILNPDTIPSITARVVCGAANNQLLDEERDARLLHERGVLYVPDYLANRMGIVNCANEQYGSIENDPALLRHYDRNWDGSVYNVTRRVLQLAQTQGVTTMHAANCLADDLAREPHPIFGARTSAILRALIEARWAEAGPRRRPGLPSTPHQARAS
jgi:glutamate dehydrogenase/leucine dehydrogenase